MPLKVARVAATTTKTTTKNSRNESPHLRTSIVASHREARLLTIAAIYTLNGDRCEQSRGFARARARVRGPAVRTNKRQRRAFALERALICARRTPDVDVFCDGEIIARARAKRTRDDHNLQPRNQRLFSAANSVATSRSSGDRQRDASQHLFIIATLQIQTRFSMSRLQSNFCPVINIFLLSSKLSSKSN